MISNAHRENFLECESSKHEYFPCRNFLCVTLLLSSFLELSPLFDFARSEKLIFKERIAHLFLKDSFRLCCFCEIIKFEMDPIQLRKRMDFTFLTLIHHQSQFHFSLLKWLANAHSLQSLKKHLTEKKFHYSDHY